MGAAPPTTFAALAVPNFRRYVSGQAMSLIGTRVGTVAQALLVLKLTHSGIVLGLTTAARYAPTATRSGHLRAASFSSWHSGDGMSGSSGRNGFRGSHHGPFG